MQEDNDKGKGKGVDSLMITTLKQKFYARIQLPYLSLSLVDSDNAREIMQCSVFGLEARHFVNTKYTDSVMNVMWVQVDNQLPDQISTVLLSPAPVKRPQPTIRLQLRKNNIESKDDMKFYETVQLVIQTLDMRLEQQVSKLV